MDVLTLEVGQPLLFIKLHVVNKIKTFDNGPWAVHGRSMKGPWKVHGPFMEPWTVMDLSWNYSKKCSHPIPKKRIYRTKTGFGFF